MHGFALAALAVLGTTATLADRAAAQPAQSRATARTVIADATLPTVVAEPLRFELMSVTQAGSLSSFEAAAG